MAQRDQSEMEALRCHLFDVEVELARYAAAYGLSDQARDLLGRSPLGRAPSVVRAKEAALVA